MDAQTCSVPLPSMICRPTVQAKPPKGDLCGWLDLVDGMFAQKHLWISQGPGRSRLGTLTLTVVTTLMLSSDVWIKCPFQLITVPQRSSVHLVTFKIKIDPKVLLRVKVPIFNANSHKCGRNRTFLAKFIPESVQLVPVG